MKFCLCSGASAKQEMLCHVQKVKHEILLLGFLFHLENKQSIEQAIVTSGLV